MNVAWTANAIRQLNGIYEYIAKDSEFYASRIVDRLTSRSIQIQEHALSGEMFPEFGDTMIHDDPRGHRGSLSTDLSNRRFSVIRARCHSWSSNTYYRTPRKPGVTIDCESVVASLFVNRNRDTQCSLKLVFLGGVCQINYPSPLRNHEP